MNLDYLTTAANWWGPTGILLRIYEHLDFTVVSVLIADVILRRHGAVRAIGDVIRDMSKEAQK